MFKNGANSAIDLKTFGNSNSGVNSDVLIRLDSGGDPTPGANAGTITYNINGSDRHIMTGSSFGINTITPGSHALNVNGTTLFNGTITLNDHLTVGSYANAKYGYLGGLRIGGWDGNTIYQDIGDLGITVKSTTPKITFNFFGGNNTIMDIKNTSINFYQPVYFANNVWHSSREGCWYSKRSVPQ